MHALGVASAIAMWEITLWVFAKYGVGTEHITQLVRAEESLSLREIGGGIIMPIGINMACLAVIPFLGVTVTYY